MKNLNITIPSSYKIRGSHQLYILKVRGTRAAITDYAIISGGYVLDSEGDFNFKEYYIYGSLSLENRIGSYWTKTGDGDLDTYFIGHSGKYYSCSGDSRNIGVRPILHFSSIYDIYSKTTRNFDNILEMEYGEYPQKAASKELQKTLEELYQQKSLMITSKKYTRDETAYNNYNQEFQKEEQEEYWYNGKKYARVRVNSCYDGKKIILSNGEKYQNGEYVWIEVEPIIWWIDEKQNIAVAEKILLAGVQFKYKRDYEGEFEDTDLKYFLDTYFSKEILVSSYENNIEENNIPNYQLQTETRNPIITSANFSPEHGLHILVKLPTEVIEPKEITVTVQTNNKELKKVYTLK